MFGYIRPARGELRVKEFELYKSCYCGLCRTLGKQYGPAARMVLQYDFTFLAMLLWEGGKKPLLCAKRCMASPCKKHCEASGDDSMAVAAGYSVILAWWKICDTIHDEGFFRSVFARGAKLWVRRAYRKAAKQYPEFDARVRESMNELFHLEKVGENRLDRMADAFAKILAYCAESRSGDEKRILEQLLYHVGRWIYIVDAVDDLEKDRKNGQYNPVDRRFALNGKSLSEEDKAYLEITLAHSRNLAAAAFELLKENCWSEILRNILYLGMTQVSGQVLSGTFRHERDGLPR